MGHSCRTLLWDTLVGHSDRIIVGQIWTREERWLAGVLFCLRCRPSFLLPPSTSSCRTLPFQALLLHSCLFTVHRLRFGLLSIPFFSSSSLRLRSRLLSLPTLSSPPISLTPFQPPRLGSFVSQVCHCWCPPFSAGHVAFLFICLPGLSLLVSALFRWLCGISIHLSPRSVHVAFLFILSPRSVTVISMHLSPRSVAAGVRPFPLAM